jgi:hypothetical protein
MSCGELGPIDGGLIKNSTIQNSTITGSSFTNGLVSASDLEACNLKSTASVDPASARVIADAIASDPSAAGELADALLGDAGADAIMQTIAGSNPAALGVPQDVSQGDDLPTDMYGSRDAVLGKPVAWMKLGDYLLPLYLPRS